MNKQEILKEFRKGLNLYTIEELKDVKNKEVDDPIIQGLYDELIEGNKEKDIKNNLQGVGVHRAIEFNGSNVNSHRKINIELDTDLIETELYYMIKENIETALKSESDIKETLKDKTVKAYEDRIVVYDKNNKPLRIFDFKDLNDTLEFICHVKILNYLKDTYVRDIIKVLFTI